MRQYFHWKTYLVVFALIIVGIALYYFSSMVNEMEAEERKRAEIVIEGIQAISTASFNISSSDITFASKIVTENTSIPLIITDNKDNIIGVNNLDTNKLNRNPDYILNKLKEFKERNQPIEIDYISGKSYIYYGDSSLLNKLRYYPLVLLSVVMVFIIIVLIAISNVQRSIQNQVWVGMSKETAHQLGTPLSSIVAWTELLKESGEKKEWITEMEKDIERLQLIADRFSKIGSTPLLQEENLVHRLCSMVEYMSKRAPVNVKINLNYEENEIMVLLSGPLFDWVIENLIRNALDAMEGKGDITILLRNTPRQVIIDVSDTGKGIPKKDFKRIFAPGFSTKQRGWGLGLSLVKRIIEKYHDGNIFVKQSEPDKGTTFRIILYR